MPFLDEQRRSYYRRWTTASPRGVVVLLHGFGEHGGHYHRFAHDLGERGLEVWGLDLPGHGLSSGERGRFGSVADLAAAATPLVDRARHQHPDLPLTLVGHSLGGVTAALMVSLGLRPEALVLTGTPLSGLPIDVVADPVMSLDESYLDALAVDPLGFDTAPAEPALWESIAEVRQELEAGLPDTAVPTLFLNGDRDAFAPVTLARDWAALLPNARVEVVQDGHHDVVNDLQHRQVAEIVGHFLLNAVRPTHQGVTP